MIYTITLNPAIDYVIHTGPVISGATNRADSENMYIGGKGINVSLVLHELGIPSTAMGFIAGFTGDAIEKGLKERGIGTDFVRLPEGNSRINVKVKSLIPGHTGILETELNGQGPGIRGEAFEELLEKVKRLKEGDTLVLSGSIPGSLSADTYERILDALQGKAVRVAADATGELLLRVLPFHPFLIKPNHEELAGLFGLKEALKDTAQIAEYAGKLQAMGARNVLVSRGKEGALLLTDEGGVHICPAFRGTLRNSVGAGDSMVAGFLAGLDQIPGDYPGALRLGTAAGSATAFSEGLAARDDIMALLEQP